MKLLILTQKVDKNDDVLGFFHGWIEEFAKQCAQVTVVCLYEGEYDLPQNVRVLSLGKEEHATRLQYLWRFYRYVITERKNYDAVFVHMNPLYVVLGGILWRIWKKRISLWYTHKHVDVKLKIAEKLTNIVFTASKESFRLPSTKLFVVGHGINTHIYTPKPKTKAEELHILTIGRISPVKSYEVLIHAVAILSKKGYRCRVSIIGGADSREQKEYFAELNKKISENTLEHVVQMKGSVPNKKIVEILRQADLFVNMSETGSLDKAVLEAMAVGIPVITSNEGLKSTLAGFEDECMFEKGNAQALAEKIIAFSEKHENERAELGKRLREVVVRKHSLDNLITKINNIISG